MGHFAHKQKPTDAETSSRTSRPSALSLTREARPLAPLLVDESQPGLTLTPVAEFLLSEEPPISREAPRLPYSLPGLRSARPSPSIPRGNPHVIDSGIDDKKKTDRVEEEEEEAQQFSGKAIIQRSPIPGTPPDHPETRAQLSGRAPKSGASSKISVLHAQSAEIQYKLAQLDQLKTWRTAFRAAIKEQFALTHGLFKELDAIEKDLQESEGWLFEYEPAKYTWQKWDRLNRRVGQMYWDTRNASESEDKYERESQKTEADLRKQQASIDAEIQTFDKAGSVVSQSQYDSLILRLTQSRQSVDKLSDAELAAAVRYTGSGPGSRIK